MRPGDTVYLLSLRHNHEIREGLIGNSIVVIVADDVAYGTGEYLEVVRMGGLQKAVTVGKQEYVAAPGFAIHPINGVVYIFEHFLLLFRGAGYIRFCFIRFYRFKEIKKAQMKCNKSTILETCGIHGETNKLIEVFGRTKKGIEDPLESVFPLLFRGEGWNEVGIQGIGVIFLVFSGEYGTGLIKPQEGNSVQPPSDFCGGNNPVNLVGTEVFFQREADIMVDGQLALVF